MLSCFSHELFVTPGTVTPGSSVREILQARIQEWVAISFSRGSSQPRDRTRISCIAGTFFTTEPPGKPDLRPKRLQVAACLGLAPWNSKAGKNQGKGDTEKRRPSLGPLGTGEGSPRAEAPPLQWPPRSASLPHLPSHLHCRPLGGGPREGLRSRVSVVSSCPNRKGDSGLMGVGPEGAPL